MADDGKVPVIHNMVGKRLHVGSNYVTMIYVSAMFFFWLSQTLRIDVRFEVFTAVSVMMPYRVLAPCRLTSRASPMNRFGFAETVVHICTKPIFWSGIYPDNYISETIKK
jgi:hypothetical protein